MSDNPKAKAAETWFGYGRWNAPYWFIGKEPGGTDEPEQYASWLRLGGGELIDCRQHDRDCASDESKMLWHGPNAKLQPTWRPLIALLLAHQGESAYDSEAVRHYQSESWGTVTGDSAVIELSAVAAPSTSVAEAKRLTHLEARIATIQAHVEAERPKFVLFYGGGNDAIFGKPYIERWSKIAGVDLTQNQIAIRNGIAYVATPHPTAHGITNDFWLDLGRQLATK